MGALREHLPILARRHRLPEVKALYLIAALGREEFELRPRFHTLGHYVQIQAVR